MCMLGEAHADGSPNIYVIAVRIGVPQENFELH